MTTVDAHLDRHEAEYLERLKDFLRIPSVSAVPAHRDDIRRCAEFVAEELRQAGLTRIEIFPTAGHPVVYGERLDSPGRPTVLVYGHYDVQPVDPVELWATPPFEPVIRDGNLYARGSADDKGQVILHWKAVETLLAVHDRLPVNVKFLVEGEEEIGSVHLDAFVRDHRELLRADVVVISDSSLFERGLPSITYALRGLAYLQIDLTGPQSDLHSGSFGGSIANPIQVLADLIAAMKDRQGRITIPGFYDKVRPLSEEERRMWAGLPFDEEAYRAGLGAPAVAGEEGYTTLERIWARPTFEPNGIWGGYQGEGSKTVLPSRAGAKVSFRLVPDQDPEEIRALFERHLRALCPPTVTVEVRYLSGGKPYLTPIDHPTMRAANRALERAFGRRPVYIRAGGSIPVVATLQAELGAPSLLVGFGLPDENSHAPDEHFALDNFHRGLRTAVYLLEELAEVRFG